VETVSALEKQLSVQKAAVEPITATPIEDQPVEVAAEVK
jgi:hypothetical protein